MEVCEVTQGSLLSGLGTLHRSLTARMGSSLSAAMVGISTDLHSVKSLLAYGNTPELLAKAQSLELLMAKDYQQGLSSLGPFLAELEVFMGRLEPQAELPGLLEDTKGYELFIPPLLVPSPALDAGSVDSSIHEDGEHFYVIRVVLDIDEDFPQARLQLLQRRLDSNLAVLDTGLWSWCPGKDWHYAPRAREAEIEPDGRVFWRGIVRTSLKPVEIRQLVNMSGILVLLVDPWEAEYRIGLESAHLPEGFDLIHQKHNLMARNNLVDDTFSGAGPDQGRMLAACRDWSHYAGTMAAKQDKMVSSLWIVEAPALDPVVLDALSRSVIQLVRNSVKHGIESQSERQKADKNALGTLAGLFYPAEHRFCLHFCDDGAGIDLARIASKAGLEPGTVLDDLELRDILAKPGMSQAKVTDVHGGQGLGLTVLSNIVETELWGAWSLTHQPGQATSHRLFFPRGLLSLSVLIFSWGQFNWAIPLAYVCGSRTIRRKYLQEGSLGHLQLEGAGKAIPVTEPWRNFSGIEQGLDQLWPSDQVQLVLLGKKGHVEMAQPYTRMVGLETVTLPLRAESVYSRSFSTWLPLFEP